MNPRVVFPLCLILALNVGAQNLSKLPGQDAGTFGDAQGTGPVAIAPPGASKVGVLLDWRTFYPWDRAQARGVRWSNPWMNTSSQWQWLFGQYTFRYAAANDGTGTNRPNPSLPAMYSFPGYYGAHVVEYYNNVNASTRQNPKSNQPYDYNDLTNYQEVQSMTPDGRYLETWGYGGFKQFITFFDNDNDKLAPCASIASAQHALNALGSHPEYRKPLIWGLPFPQGYRWDGPVSCRADLYSYTVVTRIGLAFVTIENNSTYADATGTIVKARNLYYVDQGSGLGSDCIPGEATRDRFVNGASHTFCVAGIEVYAMRSVPPEHKGRNGFGSWAMITSDPSTWSKDANGKRRPCLSIDNCPSPTASWNQLWQNDALGATSYEECSLVNFGSYLSCSNIKPPSGG